MESRIMNITPAMAKAMLDATTTRNRSVSKDIVRYLANCMTRGTWKDNGESIILDDNGNVIDGQHRLHAIVKSGTTQRIVVVKGVDPEAFETIDSGRKRSYGDILSIKGIPNCKNAAAVCGALFTYEKTGSFSATTSPVMGELISKNPEYRVLDEYQKRLPLILDSIDIGRKWYEVLNTGASRSLVSAMHYIFASISLSDATSFFGDTIALNFCGTNDPRRRLYEAVTMRGRREIAKSNSRIAASLFIKAWNIYRLNGECKYLRQSDNDTLPKPI